jgi:hypothetical protein
MTKEEIMAKFNLTHIAQAYCKDDLEKLSEQCAEFAGDLWTLANIDLKRGNGTLAITLNEMADLLEDISRATWAARKLQEGKTVVVYEGGLLKTE